MQQPRKQKNGSNKTELKAVSLRVTRSVFFSIEAERFPLAVPQNFISDIFYLTLAMNHRGYMKTISNYEEMQKEHSELQRHVEMLEGDGSWRGVSE